jgi:four helix bundle protein
MHIYSFERLEVWQKARELTKEIYLLTSKFPEEEKYSLTNQIRRAIISVSSNLAEGSSRKTSKEQARFTQMAFSSLLELLNQIIISFDLGFVSEEELIQIRSKIEELSNKINAFYNSQINKSTNQRITRQ